jgi:hypothetical protein
MKKVLCFLILACLILGTAFAQQRPANPPPAPAQPAKPANPPPAQPAKPAQPANSSNESKSALAIDMFQMFKGFIASDSDSKTFMFINNFSYERLIAPHFSLGANLDLWFLTVYDVSCFYFGTAVEGRYYTQANFDKFFLGTTLGINSLSIDGKTDPIYGGFLGFIISLKAGYKIVIKNMFIEPSMAYVLSKVGTSGISTPSGWNPGLRFGFQF